MAERKESRRGRSQLWDSLTGRAPDAGKPLEPEPRIQPSPSEPSQSPHPHPHSADYPQAADPRQPGHYPQGPMQSADYSQDVMQSQHHSRAADPRQPGHYSQDSMQSADYSRPRHPPQPADPRQPGHYPQDPVQPGQQRSSRQTRGAGKRSGAQQPTSRGWSAVPAGEMQVVEEELGDGPLVDPVYDADDRNWVRYRPYWGGFARLVVLVVLVIVAALWVRGRAYSWIDAQITPEGPSGDPVELTIAQGTSINAIAGDLQNAEVVSNATVFRYWLRCEGNLTIIGFLGCDAEVEVEAGDYILFENMDFESVKQVLDAGPVPEVIKRITVPEGLHWEELVDRLLVENPEFEREDLEAAYVSLVREALYLPENALIRNLEGMLFPATYDVGADYLSDEQGFLLRMSDEFDKRFARLLEDPGMHPDVVEFGLSPYEVIIVASLIEEEALLQEERAKIARVVYNRLTEGMRLGIDATACYAARKPCTELTVADLRSESPWNTRAVSGLPPTPIAAPGEASLIAALQPAEGDWLFYVRTDEGGVRGAHHFHRTLAEHEEQVAICRELGYC